LSLENIIHQENLRRKAKVSLLQIMSRRQLNRF